MGVRGSNSNEEQSEQGFNPNQQKQNRQKLYQLLIEPIADLLPENEEDRVIFIPHQELFFVSFPALQDPQNNYWESYKKILKLNYFFTIKGT